MTTHETMRDQASYLNQFEWSAIIVDEFHKLKNDESQISKAYYTFKKIKRRIGLSGTILQNGVMELWALLDWYYLLSLLKSTHVLIPTEGFRKHLEWSIHFSWILL